MTRLLPHPVASAGLLALWLLLNQSLSPGHLLFGAVAAVVGGWSLSALELPKLRLRRVGALFHLAALVVADITLSNLAVARIILSRVPKPKASGFVSIPLALRNPYGLAVLAGIITSTPGTLWVAFDEASGTLTIHVFDLVDENEWIHTIKGRYERLLLEILA